MSDREDIVETAFFAAFNSELADLGDAARIQRSPPGSPAGTMEIVDPDGAQIGLLPRSVEPLQLAAFMAIYRRTRSMAGSGE